MGDMLRFDAERLRILIERHHLHTGSARARELRARPSSRQSRRRAPACQPAGGVARPVAWDPALLIAPGRRHVDEEPAGASRCTGVSAITPYATRTGTTKLDSASAITTTSHGS